MTSRLTFALRLRAQTEGGPLGTRHSSADPDSIRFGGLGLCGASIEDTSACIAAIETFKSKHGALPTPTRDYNSITQHMNAYQRSRLIESAPSGGGDPVPPDSSGVDCGSEGIAFRGEVDSPRGQYGIVERWSGGIGVCGATVEDVAGCRAMVETHQLAHGVSNVANVSDCVPDSLNMYLRPQAQLPPEPEPPPPPPEPETIGCTIKGLAEAGYATDGPKATRHGQKGLLDKWSGGIGVCGATVEDVAGCRAMVGTHDLPHGDVAPSSGSDCMPGSLNMYLRPAPSEPDQPPEPPPPAEPGIVGCTIEGLAEAGFSTTGPKTTNLGQKGLLDKWEGGIGVCGATVEDVAGCRSVTWSFDLKHGVASPTDVVCDFPEHMNVYNRYTPPGAPPLRPVFSGSYDMKAFVRALAPSSSDLTADIFGDAGPRSSLYAFITGWSRANPYDLTADIFGTVEGVYNIYATIKGFVSTSTSPLEYEETIIATPLGLAVIRRLVTSLPDLTASIQGWVSSDLGAFIVPRQLFYSDIFAYVGLTLKDSLDLTASVIPTFTSDILAALTTIPYTALQGSIVTIPPKDLYTSITPVSPKDLYASGGGHLPEDLIAALTVQQPLPLLAWIRVGGVGTSDLAATIAGTGGYSGIVARVKPRIATSLDLPVFVTPRVPVDIYGYITGWREADLLATVTGVRVSDIGGYIKPVYADQTRDLRVFIRPAFGGVEDMRVFVYGKISAHTTDKPVNYHLFSQFPDRILIAQRKGLSMLQLEVVRGVFPDLHATITGIPFFTKLLKAFIRPQRATYEDFTASIKAVTRTIHITKLLVNMVNVSDLNVFISAYSGYNQMSANIIGSASTSTGTSTDAGWVYTSTIVRFYLGTSKGLLVPNRRASVLRPDVFLNNNQTPDLWAYTYGWDTSSITASLSVQLFSVLPASVVPLDLSHTTLLSASIVSTYTYDIMASISSVGAFVDVYGDIVPIGGASDLSASIRPYLKILGFRLIPVETQPFYDMRAILNPIAGCGYVSSVAHISAFIRAQSKPVGQGDLYASIYPLTDRLDIYASVIGRRKVAYKFADLSFRARTRLSSSFSALVVGIGHGTRELVASITGLYHESYLSASITPVRYYIRTRDPIGTIDIYKEEGFTAYVYKTLELTFSSQIKEYVYDALDNAVYPIGDDRWALNVSELTEVGGFFDRSPSDRSVELGDIIEYDSIDEAIRGVIILLTEGFKFDLLASITASGGYSPLSAVITAQKIDRVSDLTASVTLVTNIPDLYASITAYSGYNALKAKIVGYSTQSPEITADIYGVVYESLAASIVGTI